MWLYRNVPEWLKANLPIKKLNSQVNNKQSKVNWQALDKDIAETVKVAALRIKSYHGKPIMVTKKAIARENGDLVQLTRIRNNIKKLPLTSIAFTEVLETPEEFAIRKIRWAANCLHEEGKKATRYQLIRRAGMQSSPRLQDQSVKDAIDAALDFLTLPNVINCVENLPEKS